MKSSEAILKLMCAALAGGYSTSEILKGISGDSNSEEPSLLDLWNEVLVPIIEGENKEDIINEISTNEDIIITNTTKKHIKWIF